MASPLILQTPITPTGFTRSSLPSATTRATTRLSQPDSPLSKSRTRRTSRSTARSRSEAEGLDSVYEWHDLPPILKMKEAVTRKHVCSGVKYVLPIDKGKNSVENIYRTNLRVVFQEPYLKESNSFDEMKLRASAGHHFSTNKPPSPYTPSPDLTDYTTYKVNVDSAKIRSHYHRTAPTSGITGRQTRADSESLENRSKLYLPMKTNIPPEAIKLKKEAEKILQSVNTEYDSLSSSSKDDAKVAFQRQQSSISGNAFQKLQSAGSRLERQPSDSSLQRQKATKRALHYNTYRDCKDAYQLVSRELPKKLQSPFIEKQKADNVWQWLSDQEYNSDFEHFMDICS